MSWVILLVIKPSNIKLTFKSLSLLSWKVSFIVADTWHFVIFLLDTFNFLSDAIPVSFEGIVLPSVCILMWKSVHIPRPQPPALQADEGGCTSSRPVRGVSRQKVRMWPTLRQWDTFPSLRSSWWGGAGGEGRQMQGYDCLWEFICPCWFAL